ncbi:MAG: short-chain dehydrogenase [Bdellovibrionales bacterium CG12_big_fil_rev_8_21_14_0_65_38_15]|nr:MAG: short-chain dehydrogenase [Bdellovibrionales bacterium CG22_combo_CG10-13_8_21_14_all_38_13]PIQ53529.1 MAG: short-chain dehydrogenase [Bdellovibrionales bacterium CG12_big_fil_rev_8_21_14_0_65_38_15]PIR28467.1 MAG: short-chain dehydrogenase [Bdellovibrionales bacterium CG11_big_fil_rev_8_21_14_0_20_38_13]
MSKKVFITGGTTGIGFELAKAYALEGNEVGVCGRDITKLPADYKKSYPTIKAYNVDVTNSEQLINAVNDFAPQGLDLIIANAGIGVGSKKRIPDFAAQRKVFDINVGGVINAFEAAYEKMMNKKSGHLVAIASVAGFVGLPGNGAYSGSKAAVIKLCESMQLDTRGTGLNVTCICPGFIDTPLTQKNDHPMPFLMPSHKGASLIKNAIDNKETLFIFPWQMKIVITLLDKLPRAFYRMIMSFKFANYSKE